MAAILSFTVFRLTLRVAEPEGPAHCLRPSANSVTGQGLRVATEGSEAGNAVLCEGGISYRYHTTLSQLQGRYGVLGQ
jgi:hypothetical protein